MIREIFKDCDIQNGRYIFLFNPKKARTGRKPWAVVCTNKMRVVRYCSTAAKANKAADDMNAADRMANHVSTG